MGTQQTPKPAAQVIKCVIWDLDDTLWHGVLSEGDATILREGMVDAIQALDRRGILQSVASRNDAADAEARLRELGLLEYFLYPQIHWGQKADSVATIAHKLNIGLDALAFVDDAPYEREAVKFAHPAVLCVDAADAASIGDLPQLAAGASGMENRRSMYLTEMARQKEQEAFSGPRDEFLATLEMVFTISPARRADLDRAAELTVRTNQLNTTGVAFSKDELVEMIASDSHLVLIAGLEDRLGDYGQIGLAVVERGEPRWSLELLLMSCRVLDRGVGALLLANVMGRARKAGAVLRARFVPTGRNRMMYATYKFAGFEEIERREGQVILEHGCEQVLAPPAYVTLKV